MEGRCFMTMSWGRTRKILEENLLCEKLRGRVQYFFTIYHNAPDQYGRFAIRVDATEIFQANPYNEIYYNKYLDELRKNEQVPFREWSNKDFVYDEINSEIEKKQPYFPLRREKQIHMMLLERLIFTCINK